jgi:hypothetical protein
MLFILPTPMRSLFILLLLFSISLHAAAKPQKLEFNQKKGHHTARLVITTKAFLSSAHQIQSEGNTSSLVAKIDGNEPLGVDGGMPEVEIDTMTVFFDGKRIDVPRKWYVDCYEPDLDKNHFIIQLDDSATALLVFMLGSDATGNYQVLWILRKDGHHSRFTNRCSDCDYTVLLNSLKYLIKEGN